MKDGIKAMRKLRGYSLRELASLSGIPAGTIENWEQHGADMASAGKLKKVADALGVKVDDLL